MDADPALPPEPAEPAGAGAPSPDPGFGESAEFPRQKRRYRREDEPPADAPPITDPDIAAISTLLASLIAKKQAPPPAEEAKAAKIYRFVPKSGQPPVIRPALYDPREPAGAQGIEESDGPVAAEAGAPPPAAPRAATPVQWKGELEEGRKRPVLAAFLYSLLVLVVAGGAFWAGNVFPLLNRNANAGDKQAAGAADASPAPAWSDGELSQLDRALTADQAGDLEKALAVAMTLRSNSGPLPGLDLYLSSIETRQLQFIEAEKKLRAMGTEPDAEAWLDAEIDTQRGFNLVRERRFDRAAKSFERAALENPFEPVYFRNWAEALRRYGRLQEAITRFQEEILRYPEIEPELVNERQGAEFKIRLCQIEAGQDQPVKAALEEHLASAKPGGYWYFTGAAYALSHGDMAGAAAALAKAKEAMPLDQFEGILGDYFFRTYSTRTELASFFTEDSQERQQRLQASMLYFIDP